MADLTLEHIDPRNGELVCGLCNEFNEIFADFLYNSRKTNRFVPYRVCEYPAPNTFGDIGEFLIEEEWVVCEFGGTEWWAESNRVGNANTKGGKIGGIKGIQKRRQNLIDSGQYTEFQKQCGKLGNRAAHEEVDEQGRSLLAVKMANASHSKRDEYGRSLHPNAQSWVERSKQVVLMLQSTGELFKFPSIRMASKQLDLPYTSLCRVLSGERPSVRGYVAATE